MPAPAGQHQAQSEHPIVARSTFTRFHHCEVPPARAADSISPEEGRRLTWPEARSGLLPRMRCNLQETVNSESRREARTKATPTGLSFPRSFSSLCSASFHSHCTLQGRADILSVCRRGKGSNGVAALVTQGPRRE